MERQWKHGNNSLENISEEEELVVLIDKAKLPEELVVLIDKAKLPEEFSVKEQYIYRVPQKVRCTKEAAYTPRVVSIGPYHNGHERLKLMEPLKLGYLKSFLQGSGLTLENCISKLKEWEPSIRNCYAESIPLDSDAFLNMILIDAGFIIEFFLRYYDAGNWVQRDPLFGNPWLADDLAHDLILLENQLPFFVLKRLFNLAIADYVIADFPTFLHLAFKFFEYLNPQKLQPNGVTSVRHFTDLLRIFYLPPSERLPRRSEVGNTLEHLYSAHQLVKAGVKFKVDKSKKCLLELQYKKGVLTMPCLDLSDDRIEFHMRYIVAFEQGHYPSEPYIIDYLKILEFLVETDKDVKVLVNNGIITTRLGDSDKVATMINHLCSNLIQPHMNLEYLSISRQLNEFYDSPVNEWKATVKEWKADMIQNYCNTPVKIATSIAATLMLILTAIQTVCTLIPLAK